MAAKHLYHTVQIVVKVPYADKAEGVENAINAALDEPPCDWGLWTVGAARVVQSTETEEEGLFNEPPEAVEPIAPTATNAKRNAQKKQTRR